MRNGQQRYRGPNGRFVKGSAWRGAQAHRTSRVRTTAYTGVRQTRTGRIVGPGPMSETALIVVGPEGKPEGVAGMDVQRYDPSLSPGQVISESRVKELRRFRQMERAFFGFWTAPGNRDLSKDEAYEKFSEFIERIRQAVDADEILDLKLEYGLTGASP